MSDKKDQKDKMNGQPEATEEAQVQEQALPDAESAEADPIAKMEAELSEARDKYLRLYSEFDNYKKRIARDRLELIRSAAAETLLSFLPVLDDMERALKAINDKAPAEEGSDKKVNPDVNALKEGMQLVYQKMKSVLESRGVKPMESVGTVFDSELHDAITNIPAPSEDMKGKVVEEIQKGYYLNDKVLRHAKVIVGN